MRNALSGLTLILVIVTLAGCETVNNRYQVSVNWAKDPNEIKSIGVLEFDWKPPLMQLQNASSGSVADAGAVVADMVAAELLNLGKYAVRERTDLKRLLEEHQLQLSDVIAKGDYALIGKFANVDAIVIGRVAAATVVSCMGIQDVEVSYTCRCVSTRTGDLVWSIGGDKSVGATSKPQPPYWLRILTEELVRDLKDKLDHPPSGAQGAKSGG